MKKIYLTFIMAALAIMWSCQSEEEVYSCDEDVNQFINQNVLELNSMATENFALLSRETQRAAFRMFCPERRHQLWSEKYNYLLLNNPDAFSTEELNHIEELLNYLDVDLFQNDIKNTDMAEFYMAIEIWQEKGIICFDWTEDKIQYLLNFASISYQIHITDSKIALTEDQTVSRSSLSMSSGDCNCNYLQGTQLGQDCLGGLSCGLTQHCTIVGDQFGCGIWWLGACNGTCFFADVNGFRNSNCAGQSTGYTSTYEACSRGSISYKLRGSSVCHTCN